MSFRHTMLQHQTLHHVHFTIAMPCTMLHVTMYWLSLQPLCNCHLWLPWKILKAHRGPYGHQLRNTAWSDTRDPAPDSSMFCFVGALSSKTFLIHSSLMPIPWAFLLTNGNTLGLITIWNGHYLTTHSLTTFSLTGDFYLSLTPLTFAFLNSLPLHVTYLWLFLPTNH